MKGVRVKSDKSFISLGEFHAAVSLRQFCRVHVVNNLTDCSTDVKEDVKLVR